jgi:hypothetical protein
MSRRGFPISPPPPKKRDRNADGWQLIGFYMAQQPPGIVDLRDNEIAAALRPHWLTGRGLPDGERVRATRAHVNNKSRREAEQGLKPGDPKRVFSGWYFGYRDIKGSPTVLKDDDGNLLDPAAGLFALLGDHVRFVQHSTERVRIQGWARAAAENATAAGNIPLAIAWLDYEHDVRTFGMPQDVSVDRIRALIVGP